VDLAALAGAQELMRQALAAYGRIDVLVNNVGGTIWIKPYHLYTEEEVKLELERSLYPTLWCCLAVLPIMMTQRSGSIVNLGAQWQKTSATSKPCNGAGCRKSRRRRSPFSPPTTRASSPGR